MKKYGNEADDCETYCYVKIEPLINNIYYDSRSIREMTDHPLVENPFGIKEVFKNKHGDLQIKSSYLEIIDCDLYTRKKNKVLYLYKGGFLIGGIIREWSKQPMQSKINKVQEYIDIQMQINKLREKQKKLIDK